MKSQGMGVKPNQEAQLILSMINLNSKIHRKLGGALSVHGLGVSEFLVLSELRIAPGQTMRRVDLAEGIGLTASGVTRLLNPMEKVGLVDKISSERDARVSLVALSKSGKRVLEEVEAAVNDAAQSLLRPLDAQRQQQLREVVRALA